MVSGRPDFSREVEKIYAQKSVASNSGAVNIDAGDKKTLLTISGKGRTLLVTLRSTTKKMLFYIELDGVDMQWYGNNYIGPEDWIDYCAAVNYGNDVMLTKYDETAGRFGFMIKTTYEFQSSLKIAAFNGDTVTKTAYASVQYLDLGP